MPELVVFKAEHYELVIWSRDITASQQRLQQTLKLRNQTLPVSVVLFSPALVLEGETPVVRQSLASAVFFENRQYDFEFIFDTSLKATFLTDPPRIEHRLRAVEESFHYSERSHSLRASINTGNDIGWFKIELRYRYNNQNISQSFSFEVLPTKMDMATDLEIMNQAIDQQLPLWRFSLAEKTSQKMSARKKPLPSFLLLWLAQFEALWQDLNKGLKQIINAPHSRLVTVSQSVTMDRLKGRLSPKLEQSIAHAKAEKQWDKRFNRNKKQLSVDTPENRFIKSVVSSSINKLSKITSLARNNQDAPSAQRLSESFFKHLDEWQASMRFFQRQPLFKAVGEFNGLSKESLVLQQKMGYARVYRVWQQLKWHLESLQGESSLSLRSVAELYEVWCFLEIRCLLLSNTLGFEECPVDRIPLINNGLSVSMTDGMRGAFHFKRSDGVKIKLAHEPKFTSNGNPIKSWITTQIPDILLEATFPDGEQFIWIFDAKYRIKTSDDETGNKVPDDAINQMHRYRDALIHLNKENGQQTQKSRPVFGAYALYPGFFEQDATANPYEDAIDEIGIGAFSLLPSSDGKGSHWLAEFLNKKLSKPSLSYPLASSDRYFVEEAPRIPYRGTTVSRFTDLVLMASQLGNHRNPSYVAEFKHGKAKYYHTRCYAMKRQAIETHIILEARYLAVAVDTDESGVREISYLYPIVNAKRVQRHTISNEMAGSKHEQLSKSDEWYWLFELGNSFRLEHKLEQHKKRHFEIKLVARDEIDSCTDWDKLPLRYQSLLVTP